MKEKKKSSTSLIEKIGKKIPDPVIIFMGLYVITMILTLVIGGKTFETISAEWWYHCS